MAAPGAAAVAAAAASATAAGPLFAHPRREVKNVHVPNGKQEGVDLVCPGPKGLRFLYRYGVCVASSGSSW